MRDEEVRISTYSDFGHVGKTKLAAFTIFIRFLELNVDYVPVFVDESVDQPALPEPFLQGVGVVVGGKPKKSIVLNVFAAGAVNV